MSKTRPKPYWWHWKTYGHFRKTDRRLNRKGQRRVEDRITKREIEEQT